MARRVVRPRLVRAEGDGLTGHVKDVDRRLRFDGEAEHRTRLHGPLVEKQIVAVQIDRHAKRTLRRRHAGDVVDVRMRQQDVADRQRVPVRECEQRRHFVAGSISTASRVVSHPTTKPFLKKGPTAWLSSIMRPMIVAVLDDLMFSSKIKTTANLLGVRWFARSSESALTEMRKTPPTLVILDLNNARIGPLAIVAAMKQDAALASIPTVGYASHVQTDVINAARQAGVGEVLARSAFTQQLPESPYKRA